MTEWYKLYYLRTVNLHPIVLEFRLRRPRRPSGLNFSSLLGPGVTGVSRVTCPSFIDTTCHSY